MSLGALAIGAGTAVGGLASGLFGGGGGGGMRLPKDLRGPVNVGTIDAQVRDQSIRNLLEGRGIEREFRPEFADARTAVDQQLLERLGAAGDTRADTGELRRMMLQDLMGEDQVIDLPELEESPLQQAAFDQAWADIEAGGTLPREIQNLVARSAMGRAGDAMGTGLGRDITARDLGQTALGLRQQRLGTAAQLGTQQAQQAAGQQQLRHAINLTNQQLLGQRRQERQGGLAFLEDLGFRDFQTGAQATFGTALPQTGLDPGSIADITMADRTARLGQAQQQAAISAQQRSAQNQMMGGIFGAGIGALGQYAGAGGFQ